MNAPAKSLLDIDAFPLVQVREMPRELADVERWLEEVEALLAVERAGERGAGPGVRPRHGEGTAERAGDGDELVTPPCP